MASRLKIIALVTLLNIAAVVVLVAVSGGSSQAPAGGQLLPVAGRPDADAPDADAPDADVDSFDAKARPFLAQYCYTCHGPERQKADLALHTFDTELSVKQQRKLWTTVLHMVRKGEMPFGKAPKPTLAQRLAFLEWVEATLNDIDCTNPDPGRVTIRRLNKVEYNNTVRDLLGVDFNPAEDFPDDDVGYGFDNIGDVLSLPPVLLEKYLAAAEEIARQAVLNDPGNLPRAVTYKPQDLDGGEVRDGDRVLDGEDEIFIDQTFTRSGDYELHIVAYEQRGGTEHARLTVSVDARDVKTFEVLGTAKDPDTLIVRTRIRQGRRRVAVRFINDFRDDNFMPAHLTDRDLFVRRLEVRPVERPEGDAQPRIFTARPADDGEQAWTQAAAAVIRPLARRAYRRPVTDEEVERLTQFVTMAKGDGLRFERGVELAMTAMLVSPHFLFRVEQDPAADDEDNIRELNDHELAVRLSYFLWSSMPDEALFEAAEKGRLSNPAVLEQQIKRMLADDRARSLVKNFAGQWLQLRSLARATPDPDRFPGFDEKLRSAMLAETELFVETVIREDRSVLELIDGRYTFLNRTLAEHYGIDGVETDHFQRVELDGGRRGGILTHASVLTITSNPTRTNPVLRGKYVLEELLGTPPPPPPDEVPPLEEGDQAELKGTLRQRMEQHRTDPVCASCHQRMDPIGFGLENYDAIGRWRDKEGRHPIDASGVLPDGQHFDGPAELKRILLQQKDLFARNLAERLLTYALGRGLEYYDKCAVDDVTDALTRQEFRFSALVKAIAQSDPFTKRRGPDREIEHQD